MEEFMLNKCMCVQEENICESSKEASTYYFLFPSSSSAAEFFTLCSMCLICLACSLPLTTYHLPLITLNLLI